MTPDATETAGAPSCLTLAPYSFSGRGPAQSCAQIAQAMVAAGLRTRVVAGRVRSPLGQGVETRAPWAPVVRRLPWGRVEPAALRLWEAAARAELSSADPRTTVVHVWPGTPATLVREANDRGFVTVREMINSALATSGPILDAAYARLGLPPTHTVTAQGIADETLELALYDYVFASNPEVERSLQAVGIPSAQILTTTFGWSPDRFADPGPVVRDVPFRAVFVGRIGVRKGVPELLDAWADAAVDGELLLVGEVDPEIASLVQAATRSGTVRLAGYVERPAAAFAASDVFVFPTHEEGGPQVTYEAAGCGLPVITTPMGAARLIVDDVNGFIVDPGSSDQLAASIMRVAGDPLGRRRWAAAARSGAAEFVYEAVGARRALMLRALLS
ncbi:glycosyltransferase [Cellulomonas sp. ICMP 17802]|uniref:glycosyltransferase n=1 Tax=Cellulomonas sp. ICMP 17802 TaxID=3239199 RepID=UPI00351B1A08